MQKTMAGATNVQQAVSGTIMAGTYIISIRTPLFDLQLPASNYSYCLPFIWDLQIVPDSGLPYIADVAPGEYIFESVLSCLRWRRIPEPTGHIRYRSHLFGANIQPAGTTRLSSQ
jgi:hypothetical protein